jgi:hypothetical protein
MTIAQLSTNELERPSGLDDAPATEHCKWSLSKAVFIALISTGYVCAALAFYFMFNQIGQH